MKRIVICCDGTWNEPRKDRQTNVHKLYEAVLNFAADGTRQVRWYDEGVGTEGSLFNKLRGGAFGYGLGKNVQDAYTEIVRQYQAGDQIYLFGFSRGAYTARSTLGMVRKCGVLRPELIAQVQDAWAYYKNDLHPTSEDAKTFRRNHAVHVKEPDQDEDDFIPRAKLIGVWDTVGSLGIPVGRFRDKYQFHDVALTSWVENAYHALAIDEHRKDYAPTLWEQNPKAATKQHMEQRWFAGVHSDVGGGAGKEGDDDQSDRCLRWLVDASRSCGLEFDEALLERTVARKDIGRLHLDPGLVFKVVNVFRGKNLRAMGNGVAKADSVYGGTAYSHEKVDAAVLKRQETTRYKAPNVDAYWAANPAAKEEARRQL